MSLTPAQLTTLKAAAAADPAVNTQAHNDDGAFFVAAYYNGIAAPNFFVNYGHVPVADILNAITWKNFTPADAVPTDTALNVAIWNARNAMCQTLQMNVQNLILGRTEIDATKGKIVTGFQDSLSAVPSGAAGATRDAGWAAVQKVLCKKATRAEKLFADTSGGDGSSNTTAATAVFEGLVQGSDVIAAWNS